MTEEVDLDQLQARVAALVDRTWSGAQVSRLVELEGGHSGLTLAADVVGGPPGTDRVVLKVAPPGRRPVGRHDVLRQARMLARLHGREGVAVPAIHFASDDEPHLIGMGFAPGEAFDPVLEIDAEPRPADVVEARARRAARMLGHLHRVPPDEVAPGEEAVAPADELERWVPTMQAIPEELRPRAPELIDGLRRTAPPPGPTAIVHGDYRLGNILCEGTRPTAIIDWEIWSVADPRVDLSWFLVFTDHRNLPGSSVEAAGMPSAEELQREYEQVVGHPLEDMSWFHALGRFKMSAIMGHNLKRHLEGRYHDPYQERLPPTILALADAALELLEGRVSGRA